jgi:hypothetical protein
MSSHFVDWSFFINPEKGKSSFDQLPYLSLDGSSENFETLYSDNLK